jgi:hypothetical protein
MLKDTRANVDPSHRPLSTKARMVDAVGRYFDEVLGQGRLELIDALMAPDVALRGPGRPDSGNGREGLRRFVTVMRAAAPDTRFVLERRAVQGDKVAARWRAERSRPGPVPRGLYVFEFEGEQVAEIWMHDLDPDTCSNTASSGAAPSRRAA